MSHVIRSIREMKVPKVGWRIGELEVTKTGCMVVFDVQSKWKPGFLAHGKTKNRSMFKICFSRVFRANK